MKFLKNITKIFICIGMLSLFVMPSSISANSLQDPDNDGIPGTEGVDYFIVHSEIIPEEKIENPAIQPYMGPGRSIRNIRFNGGGSKPFAIKQIGYPGGIISYSDTYTVSMSATTSTGISIGDVSAALGFTVSSSYSKKIGYSYTVPSTQNGKKVKSATLSPRLNYDTYYYEFYFLEAKTGYGLADKAKSIDYIVTFTYY